jgi:hypothetical protein
MKTVLVIVLLMVSPYAAAFTQQAYDEPPQWFHPVRESLGGFMLRSGNYADAEKVFRADLERNKHSGRSLFGLMESLKAQKKTQAAAIVQKEFESAWKNADTKLSIAEL